MTTQATPAPTVVQYVRKSRVAGDIALLELNRPEVHNALNDALLRQLARELREARADDTIRAVILTGAGSSFCSGDDLKAAVHATAEQFAQTIELLQAITVDLLELDKPVIAALNGPAFGGGLELALNCDLRIATDTFVCATPEVRLGLTATNGACVLLPSLIGPARARRMLLGGARFDARWCLQCGLIDELTSAEKLLPRAIELAREFTAGAPRALAATRRLLTEVQSELWQAVLRAEARVCIAARAAEGRSGVQAFLAKQAPPWRRDVDP